MRTKAEVVPFALFVNRRAIARLEFVVDDFQFVRVAFALSQTGLVEFNRSTVRLRRASSCIFSIFFRSP